MIAYLYIRVSTDEQTDKGYSQRYQEEALRRYCSEALFYEAQDVLDGPNHDGDVMFKRQIISAIYPQNLEYDGQQFRTTHLNEVIAATFSLDAAFQKEKSRQNGVFSILSAEEVSSRFELL